MRWSDVAFVIAARKHSDRSCILTLLTKNYGVCKGYITVTKNISIGTKIQAQWYCKSLHGLGYYKLEVVDNVKYIVWQDRIKINALTAICTIITHIVVERENNNVLYEHMVQMLLSLNRDDNSWIGQYLKMEMLLLDLCGFGMNLRSCAVTKSGDNLAFISPDTGVAVSYDIGKKCSDKLFTMPEPLICSNNKEYPMPEYVKSLEIIGYFLDKFFYSKVKFSVPVSRDMFIKYLIIQYEDKLYT